MGSEIAIIVRVLICAWIAVQAYFVFRYLDVLEIDPDKKLLLRWLFAVGNGAALALTLFGPVSIDA